VDTAESAEDIDVDRARAAKARAEERLKTLAPRTLPIRRNWKPGAGQVRLRVAERKARE
jgi:F0F1-type ATP synthase epsilon subunit